MKPQEQLDYERIAKAIDYIREHFREQPDLDVLAREVHLSPFHFQRLFTEWAGTSPKKFLQYISLSYAKQLLQEQQATLSETAYATGLSGTGRLHDLFISIEGMTPAEYKNGGRDLDIRYRFAGSPFGTMLVANTGKGICHMSFADNTGEALALLKAQFPNAAVREENDPQQDQALSLFTRDWQQLPELKLHLRGSDFQLKVWETLLKIPMGSLCTYGRIARAMGQPKASRAAGTAIGDNPVAFLIPCHRVIRGEGHTGNYKWGSTRKTVMIGWEAARIQPA